MKALRLIFITFAFLCNCPGVNVNIVTDEYNGIFKVLKIEDSENSNWLRSSYTLQCQFNSEDQFDTIINVKCNEITFLANDISVGSEITGKLLHTYDENVKRITNRSIPDSYAFRLNYPCKYISGGYVGTLHLKNTSIFGDSSMIASFDYRSSDRDTLFPDSSFSESDTFNLTKFNNFNLKAGEQYYATWYILNTGDCAQNKFDIYKAN